MTRWYQQTITVSGVLAGMSFAALVLVLQAQTTFERASWGLGGEVYFGLLISLLGSVSALFIFASMAMTSLAAQNIEAERLPSYSRFASLSFTIAFFCLLIAIPLLMLPFDWGATVAVALVEVYLWYYWQKLPRRSPNP